jgi:hypothetical protein
LTQAFREIDKFINAVCPRDDPALIVKKFEETCIHALAATSEWSEHDGQVVDCSAICEDGFTVR